MKTTVKIEQEVEIKTIRIQVAVRYGEEDIPKDFPFRKGDMWKADVDVDTGKIADWPDGVIGNLCMKVCDSGSYTLFDADGQKVGKIEQDYVPHGIVPGEYGDYINLKINEAGLITNWPTKPDASAFFDQE